MKYPYFDCLKDVISLNKTAVKNNKNFLADLKY